VEIFFSKHADHIISKYAAKICETAIAYLRKSDMVHFGGGSTVAI